MQALRIKALRIQMTEIDVEDAGTISGIGKDVDRSHADSVTPNPCEYTAKVDKSPRKTILGHKIS